MLIGTLLSLGTISWYPFVHSDEVWLASLTRAMLVEGNLAATEDFFVLTPRAPHAIKTLYHIIQMPFLAVDYSAVAARLPSAVAGLAAVAMLYGIAAVLTRRRGIAAITAVAFAVDPHLLYTSHLARQEAIILALSLAAVYAVVRRRSVPAAEVGENAPSAYRSESGRRVTSGRSARRFRAAWTPGAVAGAIVGIGVFVHPNAFIAAAMVLPWVVVQALSKRESNRPPAALSGAGRLAADLGRYVAVLAVGGILAVAASYAMDPDFLANYASFGRAVGVGDSPWRRLFRLRSFFEKIITRNQGTYYIPPVTSRVYFGVIVWFAGVALPGTRRRYAIASLLSVVTAICALFVIGKYSPPSAIFLVPWVYLSAALVAARLRQTMPSAGIRIGRAMRLGAAGLLAVTLILPTVATLRELPRWYVPRDDPGSYRRYIDTVESLVEEYAADDGRVLANLNAGFAFDFDRLRVYRDFGALPAQSADALVGFLQSEQIDLVFLPRTELDLIYRMRPVWNDVYGNPTRFYPALRDYLSSEGERVASFTAPVYGMRLLRYQSRESAVIDVYRLQPPRR